MAKRNVVVIGASAGGVEALTQLVRHLPADLPAAVFIVLHVSPHSTSTLPHILSRAGSLPAKHPTNLEAIHNGTIYVAPPNKHLVIKPGHIHLKQGPKENGHRPSVDVLFRTAARAYHARVIGIVLSGVLDDGSAGLLSIKIHHGLALVQDPAEALYDGMPQSAIHNVEVDHVLPVAAIAELIVRLVSTEVETEDYAMSEDELKDVSELDYQGHQLREASDKPSTYVCPECGGTLWEYEEGDLIRFRCRVGHAYSPETLAAHQAENLEDAFWVALRALEENAALIRRMAERAKQRGNTSGEQRYQEQAGDIEQRAALIRQVLLNDTFGKRSTGQAT